LTHAWYSSSEFWYSARGSIFGALIFAALPQPASVSASAQDDEQSYHPDLFAGVAPEATGRPSYHPSGLPKQQAGIIKD
jgi:hypothetical protein